MSENCTEIRIGRTAENEARVVRFNVSDWQGIYGPGGAFILMHQRPNDDEPYICQASVAEDGWLEWVVKAADLQRTGRGQLQLSYVVNEQIAKSMIFTTRISRSLDQSGELPEPYEDMIEELIEAAADIVIVGQQVAADKAAADEDALKAEGHAVGKQNGEDEPSDSPYYHNNAKYYAEQAGASATAAGSSAQQAGSSAGAAASDALKAEGHAIGKQNGENVPSDSPYYHNNAKYYSEQAGLSEQQAGNSAGAAAADALKAEGYAVGKQNGEDVPIDSPYYHNSAEYYKDQAAGEAERAEAAAEDAEEYAEDAAPAIINSASGSIASFSDGADNRKIRSLVVNIDPVQDLHGQDAPSLGTFTSFGTFEQGTINGQGEPTASDTRVRSQKLSVQSGTHIIEFDSDKKATVRVYDTEGTYKNAESVTSWTASPITFTCQATRKLILVLATSNTTDTIVPSDVTRAGEISGQNICPITGWTGCEVYDDPKYGGTIDFNQLIKNGNYSDSSIWNYGSAWSIANNKATFTASASVGFHSLYQTIQVISGHKYMVGVTVSDYQKVSVSLNRIAFTEDWGNYPAKLFDITGNGRYEKIVESQSSGTRYVGVKIQIYGSDSITESISDFVVYDLTQMFGTGNEPQTVADFKTLFTKDYYAYNSGTETIVSAVNNEEYRHLEIEFPNTAGIVYGATIDVKSKKLKINKVTDVVSALVLSGFYTGSESACIRFLLSHYANEVSAAEKHGAISNYGAENYAYFGSQRVNESGSTENLFAITTGGGIVAIYDSDTSLTSQQAQEKYANMQVCYPLAELIVIQLTDEEVGEIIKTIHGANNVWADTGAVNLDYVADTKLYIDNKITQMIASALNA